VSLSIEHGFIRHVQTSLQVGAIFHIRNTTCSIWLQYSWNWVCVNVQVWNVYHL